MTPKRVVVTGMAGITALGDDYDTIERNLRAGISAVETMADWDRLKELNSKLAAPVMNFKMPAHYTRKHLRTMSRVAQLAVLATERALTQSGLLGDACTQDGRMGVAHGSCSGGIDAMRDFTGMLGLGDSGQSRGQARRSR